MGALRGRIVEGAKSVLSTAWRVLIVPRGVLKVVETLVAVDTVETDVKREFVVIAEESLASERGVEGPPEESGRVLYKERMLGRNARLRNSMVSRLERNASMVLRRWTCFVSFLTCWEDILFMS